MEWKNESRSNSCCRLDCLLDGANKLCDQYAVDPRRIQDSPNAGVRGEGRTRR
jgi:hypothetical protein